MGLEPPTTLARHERDADQCQDDSDDDEDALARAELAAEELFALAVRLGGSISGEHGVGWVKRGQLARQWEPRALELHAEIKRAFDPKGLLNPGKKLATT